VVEKKFHATEVNLNKSLPVAKDTGISPTVLLFDCGSAHSVMRKDHSFICGFWLLKDKS